MTLAELKRAGGVQYRRCGFSGRVDRKQVDTERHVVPALVSTAAIDRDQEIILPGAFRKRIATYEANPVLLWGHPWLSWGETPPPDYVLGVAEDGGIDFQAEGLLIHYRYLVSSNPTAKQCFDMVVDGGLRAYSVGFYSHGRLWKDSGEDVIQAVLEELVEDEALRQRVQEALLSGQVWCVHVDAELLEVSHVYIGCNPETLVQASAAHLGQAVRSGALSREQLRAMMGLDPDLGASRTGTSRRPPSLGDVARTLPPPDPGRDPDHDGGGDPMKTLGARLKEARGARTLEQVAARLSLTAEQLHLVEADKAVPPDTVLEELAAELSLDAKELQRLARSPRSECWTVAATAFQGLTRGLPEAREPEAVERLESIERRLNTLCSLVARSIKGPKLGAALQERREELGMSLEDVAAAMEGDGARDASTLGQIERGEILEPPEEVLAELARVLDLSLETLQGLVAEDLADAGQGETETEGEDGGKVAVSRGLERLAELLAN